MPLPREASTSVMTSFGLWFPMWKSSVRFLEGHVGYGWLNSTDPNDTGESLATWERDTTWKQLGLALFACQSGVAKENKVVAHIAVLLTLVVFAALFMPMNGAIGRGDPVAIGRVGVMMLTSLIAMIAFIASFRAARKAREAGEG